MLALVVSTFCLLSGCQGKAEEEVFATVDFEKMSEEDGDTSDRRF